MLTINEMIKKKMDANEITDEMLIKMAYGIEYFSFWGHVSDEDIIYWRSAQKKLMDRLKVLNDEQEKRSKATIEEESSFPLSGQLWEECDFCGQEPIYMNVGCCENCAKKGFRR